QQRELRLLDALGSARPRRGVAEPLGNGARSEPYRELAAKRRPKRLEGTLARRFAPAGGRFPGLDRLDEGERIPLGDKRTEPAGDAGQLLELRGFRHVRAIVSKGDREHEGTATGHKVTETPRARAADSTGGATRRGVGGLCRPTRRIV